MAYIIEDIKEEKVFDIAIYVILSPVYRSFFVGKTEITDLVKVYKKHYYGEKSRTKDLFQKAKQEMQLPQMYLLEQLQTTQETAYLHVIAWTKYFMDHGYESLCAIAVNQYAEELREDVEQIYEEIKQVPLENFCNDEKKISLEIKQKKKNESHPKQRINMNLKPAEYDLIKERAESKRMSMSKYCKSILLSEQEKTLDHEISDLFLAYLKGFSQRDKLMKQILITINSTQKYYPTDLKILQDLIEQNEQQQQEAFDRILEIVQKLTK